MQFLSIFLRQTSDVVVCSAFVLHVPIVLLFVFNSCVCVRHMH